MTFRVWFSLWIASFFKLLLIGTDPKRRDRHGRHKSRRRYFGDSKKQSKRRSRFSAQNKRTLDALLSFLVCTAAIVLLPLGLLDFGRRRIGAVHRARCHHTRHTAASKKAKRKRRVAPTAEHSVAASPSRAPAPKPSSERTGARTTKTSHTSSGRDEIAPSAPLFAERVPTSVTTVAEPPDESTPLSAPERESDQYVRARLTVAGVQYCADVARGLAVGDRLELVREPDNLHDRNAVRLEHGGIKVGYVDRLHSAAFATCLRLGRTMYAVITAVTYPESAPEHTADAALDSDLALGHEDVATDSHFTADYTTVPRLEYEAWISS